MARETGSSGFGCALRPHLAAGALGVARWPVGGRALVSCFASRQGSLEAGRAVWQIEIELSAALLLYDLAA